MNETNFYEIKIGVEYRHSINWYAMSRVELDASVVYTDARNPMFTRRMHITTKARSIFSPR
jgi:hypothetical protein